MENHVVIIQKNMIKKSKSTDTKDIKTQGRRTRSKEQWTSRQKTIK